MATRERSDHIAAFFEGGGIEPPQVYECDECGYTSPQRRNFVHLREDGRKLPERVCHTGHYTDEEGRVRRARNGFVRRWSDGPQ